MVLDRVRGEVQGATDLGGTEAAGDQPGDLLLAPGERPYAAASIGATSAGFARSTTTTVPVGLPPAETLGGRRRAGDNVGP